jgi:hypothetical protein
LKLFAVRTGLEPATLGVTGRYSNRLNYRTNFQYFNILLVFETTAPFIRVENFERAVRTGLEPATLGVTGRYSNRLNYRTRVFFRDLTV